MSGLERRPGGSGGDRALVVLPALKLLIQLAAIPGYGYFRDELYYVRDRRCRRRGLGTGARWLRETTVVFAPDYGVAGAVELFGGPLGLPRVVSGHNNYWLWGPPEGPIDTVLVVGGERSNLEKRFEEVRLGATTDCGLCMPYENHRPIWICHRPRQSLVELWPRWKHYD